MSSPIIMVLLACAAAFLVGKVLFRADEKVEDRRRHASNIAVELKSQGMNHIPELLIDYAVGDYSGLLSRLKSWYEFMREDTQRRSFFQQFLEKQLQLALADDTRRQKVLDAVDEWRAADAARKDRLVAQVMAERQTAAGTPGTAQAA